MSNGFVIGFDGGGTKTAAELCDTAGNILAEAKGGPSNFQVIGVEAAAKTILDLADLCCRKCGVDGNALAALVPGLTGAGRETDQQRMAQGLAAEAARRGQKIGALHVVSDARIALEAAFNGGAGIIVIGGTGSIVFGKDAQGAIHRAGGWGRIIGDEGSGYAIGLEAFRAIAQLHDGRGRKTALREMMAKRLGLDSQEAVINALYKQNFDVASVAPLVMEAAAAGDGVARTVLTNAAQELTSVIQAVSRNVKPKRNLHVPLAFVGSVLTNANWYSRKVRSVIRRQLPGVTVVPAQAPPVHGAALLAIRIAGGIHE